MKGSVWSKRANGCTVQMLEHHTGRTGNEGESFTGGSPGEAVWGIGNRNGVILGRL